MIGDAEHDAAQGREVGGELSDPLGLRVDAALRGRGLGPLGLQAHQAHRPAPTLAGVVFANGSIALLQRLGQRQRVHPGDIDTGVGVGRARVG